MNKETLKQVISLLRHRIIPLPAPGMTSANPLDSQPSAFQRAVFLNRRQGVFRTAGRKPARGRRERRNAGAIKPDGQ